MMPAENSFLLNPNLLACQPKSTFEFGVHLFYPWPFFWLANQRKHTKEGHFSILCLVSAGAKGRISTRRLAVKISVTWKLMYLYTKTAGHLGSNGEASDKIRRHASRSRVGRNDCRKLEFLWLRPTHTFSVERIAF